MKHWISLFLILIILPSCQPEMRHESFYYEQTGQPNVISQPQIAAIARPAPARNFRNNLIVIDAGHGGEDMGTRSLTTPKYLEKSLNLSTAMFLKEHLQKMGYQVRMTRNDDTFVSLPDRSLFSNKLKPALFVSVHYNAAESEKADGIEVYYYQSEEDKVRSTNSKKLADLVLEQVLEKTKAKSRGVKHGNLAVIREANVTAILVEGGFMTNKNEMDKIKDPAYIKQLSYGIALGINKYLRN